MSAALPGPVVFLGCGDADGPARPEVVGSKASGLARLAALGLRVPPAFVLGTAWCRAFFERGGKLPEGTIETLGAGVRRLEEATSKGFGSARRPLLLSVRSGAPVSMPGMMDTILDVGLDETTVHGLLRATGKPRLAWDSYRRLVRAWAETVRGADAEPFERVLRARLDRERLTSARELDVEGHRALAREWQDLLSALAGAALPQEPMRQLAGAVEAVFRSWASPRAREYRRLHRIDDSLGTAVTVQAMVFGNSGSDSGAGVGFTRDPSSGANALYLDFLFDAQGEDVVSGRQVASDTALLPRLLPGVHRELHDVKARLEAELRDAQDFEFTVERGRLWLLQTRTAKRTPWAALHIAVDLVDEGILDPAAALERLDGVDLDAIERVRLVPGPGLGPLTVAVPASLGVAVGRVVLDPERACEEAERGEPVVLVRDDIVTEDIAGLAAACGILTATGGRTSHAAVVARQMGKACLVGCRDLRIDREHRRMSIGARTLAEGEWLSLDGETGRVYEGRLPVARERPEAALARVEVWRRKA